MTQYPADFESTPLPPIDPNEPMKTVYLLVCDYGWVWPKYYQKPVRSIDTSLFFSSKEKFKELWGMNAHKQQLVEVQVPQSFDWLDFIPENY